jgi:hypothetical protein
MRARTPHTKSRPRGALDLWPEKNENYDSVFLMRTMAKTIVDRQRTKSFLASEKNDENEINAKLPDRADEQQAVLRAGLGRGDRVPTRRLRANPAVFWKQRCVLALPDIKGDPESAISIR